MSALRLLERFFRVSFELLFNPGKFFERTHPQGGIKLPILFAIATHWIAAAASFGWGETLLKTIRNNFSELFLLMNDAHEFGSPDGRESLSQEAWEHLAQIKAQLLPWFWGASSVLLSPFKTLGLVAWAAFFLFVASRLLVPLDPERPVTWRSSIRIACFSRTAILWSLIPVLGPFVGQAMIVVTTIVAVRKTYKISNLRAVMIALFPQLLFLGILLVGLGLIGWLAMKAFLAMF